MAGTANRERLPSSRGGATGLLCLALAVLATLGAQFVRATAADMWSPAAGLAFLRLAAALLGLAVLGGGARALLRLPRAPRLTPCVDMLYGQLVVFAYLYLRSAAAGVLHVPGAHPAELWALVAAAGGAWLGRACARRTRTPHAWHPRFVRPGRAALLEFAALLAWCMLLAMLFFRLFPRLTTPCSDTDIHAFLLRTFLDQGAFVLASPLNPAVRPDYPGGFAALNAGLAMLTGFHPVLTVNLQPYLQWALLLPAWWAIWTPRTLRPAHFTIGFMLLLLLGGAAFNPVFPTVRALLTGTGRLAHTALFFFPALHLWLGRTRRGPLGGDGFFVPVSLAAAACLNPSHAVPALLSAGAAAGVVHAWRRRHAPSLARPAPPTLSHRWGLLAGLAVAALMLAHDPGIGLLPRPAPDATVRWTHIARRAPDASLSLKPAREWTGAAAATIRDVFDAETWLPAAPPVNPVADRPLLRTGGAFLLLATAVWLGLGLLHAPGPAGLRESGQYLVLTLGGLLAWVILCAPLDPGTLLGTLARDYPMELLVQSAWTMTGFAALYPALIAASLRVRLPRVTARIAPAILAAAAIVWVFALPGMRLDPRHWRLHDVLQVEASSRIRPADMEAFAWMRDHIPAGASVLLPGVRFDTLWERWVFPRGPAAGVAHYTRLRPVFFYGLCGQSAMDYERHVTDGLDIDWLRAGGIGWVLNLRTNPIQPKDALAAHFDRVYRGRRIEIWRLRPLEPAAPLAGER